MKKCVVEAIETVQNGAESIRLTDQDLTSDDIRPLCEVLQTNTTVKVLDVSKNNIGHEGGMAIGDMLRMNHTLTELYVALNLLGPEGVEPICEALKENSRLECFGVDFNDLGPEGGKFIGEMLRSNHSIKSLSLQVNHLAPAGGKYIADALKENHGLEILDLNWNKLEPDGFIEILNAMKWNQTMRTFVRLEYMRFGWDSVYRIEAILAELVCSRIGALEFPVPGRSDQSSLLSKLLAEPIEARVDAMRKLMQIERNSERLSNLFMRFPDLWIQLCLPDEEIMKMEIWLSRTSVEIPMLDAVLLGQRDAVKPFVKSLLEKFNEIGPKQSFTGITYRDFENVIMGNVPSKPNERICSLFDGLSDETWEQIWEFHGPIVSNDVALASALSPYIFKHATVSVVNFEAFLPLARLAKKVRFTLKRSFGRHSITNFQVALNLAAVLLSLNENLMELCLPDVTPELECECVELDMLVAAISAHGKLKRVAHGGFTQLESKLGNYLEIIP